MIASHLYIYSRKELIYMSIITFYLSLFASDNQDNCLILLFKRIYKLIS